MTSYSNRQIGKEAHKAFLHSDFEGEPIMIIEDMSLVELHSSPKSVIVSPLLVEKVDGTPVTVFAEIDF